LINKGDRIVLSGTFDEEGIVLKRIDVETAGEYQFSIPLSFEGNPGSLAGAVDVSSSGDILAIELIGIDRVITKPKPPSDL